VEALTAELEDRARALLDDIETRGGMLRAIADGWVQQQIHEAAYRWQRDVESGERVVVGVNKFGDARPVPPPPFQHDPDVERRRARFLTEWRGSRSRGACEGALKKLEATAKGTSNLMPPILAALTARATLGEVCDTMRRVFGVHRPGDGT
jgi:methylmalonyl-CoA mutase N-terminal domain/subunit